jgi:hypothetical protein
MPARSSGLLDGTVANAGERCPFDIPPRPSAMQGTQLLAIRSPIRPSALGGGDSVSQLTWLWKQPSQAADGLPEAGAKSNSQKPGHYSGDDERD